MDAPHTHLPSHTLSHALEHMSAQPVTYSLARPGVLSPTHVASCPAPGTCGTFFMMEAKTLPGAGAVPKVLGPGLCSHIASFIARGAPALLREGDSLLVQAHVTQRTVTPAAPALCNCEVP